MIKLFKHLFFKYLLLVVLSLKVGHFVYENVANLHHSETISCTIDFDDFENENEEKKEFDEKEKINQNLPGKPVEIQKVNAKRHFLSLNRYINEHLDYLTPPPEVA